MKNLSIRTRIYMISVVSLLAFVTVAAIYVYEQYRTRLSIVAMQTDNRLFSFTSKLIGDLQYERGKTALFHAGGANLSELEDFRKKSDDGVRAMLAALRRSSLDKSEGKITSIPDVLAKIREDNNQPDAKRRVQAVRDYTSVIDSLIALLTDIANTRTTRGFGKEFTSMLLLETAKESAGLFRANVSSLLAGGGALTRDQLTKIIDLKSGIHANLNSPALVLSNTMRERLAGFRNNPARLAVNKTFEFLVARSGNVRTSADEFWKNASSQIDDLGELINDGLAGMDSELQKIIDDVNRSLLEVVLVMLGVIVFNVFLALKTSLYIIRGLRSVVDSMHDIAAGEGNLHRGWRLAEMTKLETLPGPSINSSKKYKMLSQRFPAMRPT